MNRAKKLICALSESMITNSDAIAKIKRGYYIGYTPEHNSCYSSVGNRLKEVKHKNNVKVILHGLSKDKIAHTTLEYENHVHNPGSLDLSKYPYKEEHSIKDII